MTLPPSPVRRALLRVVRSISTDDGQTYTTLAVEESVVGVQFVMYSDPPPKPLPREEP